MYKEILHTKNISKGVNTKQFIIIHSTGTVHGTTKGNLNVLLGKTPRKVSAHYLVSENGDKYKLAETNQITWHRGISEWKGLKDLNKYSIGIEVVGGAGEEFPYEQRVSVKELIQHLMATFNIPKENVLRHRDLTNDGSSKGILWDGKSKSRKTDIDSKFFQPKYNTWKDYQNSLVPLKMK